MGKFVTALMTAFAAMAIVAVPIIAQPVADCTGQTDGTECENGNPCMNAACYFDVCFTTTAVPNDPPVDCTGDANVGFCVDGSCDFDLPVELSSFSAIADNGMLVLEWVTASEENNAGFGIEVSVDQESFREMGFVSGAGTTLRESRYTFETQKIGSGTQFVRLRFDDLDGSSTWSEVIEVQSEIPGRFVLEAAYPNPFNPQTTIGFAVDTEMEVQLTVVNSCGVEVARLFQGAAEAGVTHEVQFHADLLPSGTYFYRLDTEEGSQIRSMTLLK